MVLYLIVINLRVVSLFPHLVTGGPQSMRYISATGKAERPWVPAQDPSSLNHSDGQLPTASWNIPSEVLHLNIL